MVCVVSVARYGTKASARRGWPELLGSSGVVRYDLNLLGKRRRDGEALAAGNSGNSKTHSTG